VPDTPPPPAGRPSRPRKAALALVAIAAIAAVVVLLGRPREVRADRQGSHVRAGQRLVWRLADGSSTVYEVRSVTPEGVVTYDRLRFDPGAKPDAPASRDERTFAPIAEATFAHDHYVVAGSTSQARTDRRRVGRVAFDCAVVRVWRAPQPGTTKPSVYEEWIPIDGTDVVFPGCALYGEDPLGTPGVVLVSVE
jgi:hypothetical protein